MELKIERCCACDEPTDKAGQGEDSLYTDSGIGPFCGSCYEGAVNVEIIYVEEVNRLAKEIRAKDAMLEEVCEERDRMKEAVEWALRVKDTLDEPWNFKAELRRLAGKDEE